MSDKYILSEVGEPVPCNDLVLWAAWIECANRHVGNTMIGDVRVSTVFLGLNYEYRPDRPHLLWETMVFGGNLDMEMERCSGTREQAEAMHARIVAKVVAEFTSAPASTRE